MPTKRAAAGLMVAVPVLVRLALALTVDDFDSDGYSRALIAEGLANAIREGRDSWWQHLYVAVWPPGWAKKPSLWEISFCRISHHGRRANLYLKKSPQSSNPTTQMLLRSLGCVVTFSPSKNVSKLPVTIPV